MNPRLLLVAAVSLVFAATAFPAVAVGSSFGAAVSPSPLVIENWRKPAFSLENRGTVPIIVDIELVGDVGYALATKHVELAPQETMTIAVTKVGDGQATVRFHVTSDVEGVDRQAIVLETSLRHQTLLESLPWPTIVGSIGVMLVLFAAVSLLVVHRRRGSMQI